MENPYANPLRQITFELPQPDENLATSRSRGKREGPKCRQNLPSQKSVSLGERMAGIRVKIAGHSLLFREAAKVFQECGDHVFVLVGPFLCSCPAGKKGQ